MTEWPSSAPDDEIPVFSSLDGVRDGVSSRRLLNLGSIAVVVLLLFGTSSLWLPQAQRIWQSIFPPAPYHGPMTYDALYDGTVQALRTDTGQVVWKTKTALNGADFSLGDSGAYTGPRLVLESGVLIVLEGRGSAIRALDAHTGTSLWRIPAAQGMVIGLLHHESGRLDALETIAGRYFADPLSNILGTLNVIDVKTGKVIWQSEHVSVNTSSSVLFADQMVFIGNNARQAGPVTSSPTIVYSLSSFDASSGKALWTTNLSCSLCYAFVDQGVVGVYLNDRIVFLNAHDGQQLWTYDIPKPDFVNDPTSYLSTSVSGIAAANGLVYISLYAQQSTPQDERPGTEEVQAFDIVTGAQRWLHTSISFSSGAFTSLPGSRVLIVGDQSVTTPDSLGVDGITGVTLWSSSFTQYTQYLQEVLVQDGVWIVSAQHLLLGFRLADGKAKWQTSDYPTFAHCALDTTTLYCVAGPHMYAIDVNSGKQRWFSPDLGAVVYDVVA